MLSFGLFKKKYATLGRARARKAAGKYRLALLHFGSSTPDDAMKAAFEDVITRTLADPRSVRDPSNPSQASKSFKVFATGPLRALSFKNPAHHVFPIVASTILAINATGTVDVTLDYLSFADEAKYGFMTMIGDPATPGKIRAALTAAGRPASGRIIVIQSGTTTCQPGVYDVDTNSVLDAMLFEYGAKNQDLGEFDRLIEWIATYTDIDTVLDAGAHGYAVQPNTVATNASGLLPAADKTKEAVDSATRFMTTLTGMGKHYVLPQRKMCELQTSPAVYMHSMYPGQQILDWGGGQVQEPVLGIKSTGFEQRSLLAIPQPPVESAGAGGAGVLRRS
jgi:hypothetical protein